MTAIHNSFLFRPAEHVLSELHQEEALVVGVEDISQTLTLVLQEVTNACTRHQVKVLVVTHLLCVLEADAMLDTPFFVTDEETLLWVFLVDTIVQNGMLNACIVMNSENYYAVKNALMSHI